MRLLVISSPDLLHTEVNTVVNLFKAGLSTFHLRKPKFDRDRTEEYLKLIPKRYRNRVVLHSYHELAVKYKLKGVHLTKSHRNKRLTGLRMLWLKMRHPKLITTRTFHRLTDLLHHRGRRYDYVFLSPLYEKGKKGRQKRYSSRAIHKAIEASRPPVIALGGVNLETMAETCTLGFHGVALQSAMWNGDGRHLDFYREAKSSLSQAIEKEPSAEVAE